MQKTTKTTPDKKVLSLEIKNQLIQSLGHLKELWGEKKFNNKVDEAVKIFTKGFKKPEHSEEPVKKEKKVAKAASDKKPAKKEAVKKESEIVPEVITEPKKQSSQKAIKKSPAKSAK